MSKYTYPVLSIRVIDGDTVEATLDLGDGISAIRSLRIPNIDAPERSTVAGKAVALVVQAWADSAIRQGRLMADWFGRDKFGRGLGDLYFHPPMSAPTRAVVAVADERLSTYLLAHGLARPYTGDKKQPWSDAELATVETLARALIAQ